MLKLRGVCWQTRPPKLPNFKTCVSRAAVVELVDLPAELAS